jgi:hypothetical protein
MSFIGSQVGIAEAPGIPRREGIDISRVSRCNSRLPSSVTGEKTAYSGHVTAVLISEALNQVHLLYARASRED